MLHVQRNLGNESGDAATMRTGHSYRELSLLSGGPCRTDLVHERKGKLARPRLIYSAWKHRGHCAQLGWDTLKNTKPSITLFLVSQFLPFYLFIFFKKGRGGGNKKAQLLA